jgi:hypothetical protein
VSRRNLQARSRGGEQSGPRILPILFSKRSDKFPEFVRLCVHGRQGTYASCYPEGSGHNTGDRGSHLDKGTSITE